tara:strand:+ start:5942 stop:6595 length:654 start_codon:yes stop_codon:yes gene_type:complete
MKLILEDENFNYIKTISNEVDNLEKMFLDRSDIDKRLNATLITFNKNISCSELQKIKTFLQESNINLYFVLTNSRETNISAQHLKMNTKFNPNKNTEFKINSMNTNKSIDLTHRGIVRSGEKISSNGNLIIIGDVNPGAQITARKNIYVWGKLCGIAFAGCNGEENSFITSLYLNPLQLRINKTIATGPKDKPNDHYPEIAILENGKIIIKPLLINK